ncbi:Putative uncharacterized protein [Moritella viscosa]|nr:Putative uncharacterized protein [Moritella viscosa]
MVLFPKDFIEKIRIYGFSPFVLRTDNRLRRGIITQNDRKLKWFQQYIT